MRDFEIFLNSTSEQREEMTDAEVFHAAVTIVGRKLQEEGVEILQVSREFGSIPAIWFKSGEIVSYIVVSFARYPHDAEAPSNLSVVKDSLGEEGFQGYWVGVSLANEFEAFDPESDEGLPLMKGFGLLPKVSELIPIGSDFANG
jgi:hypothetical protein